MTDLAHQWATQEFLKKGLGAHAGITVPLDSLNELLSRVEELTKDYARTVEWTRKANDMRYSALLDRDAWIEFCQQLRTALYQLYFYECSACYANMRTRDKALALPQPGVGG